MRKFKVFVLFLYLGVSCLGMEQDDDKYNKLSAITVHNSSLDEDEGWEIVQNNLDIVNYPPNNNDENIKNIKIKLKAVRNTALTIVGGVAATLADAGVRHIQANIERNARTFDYHVNQGTRVVGELYGHAVALRRAYENEKQILKNNGSDSED